VSAGPEEIIAARRRPARLLQRVVRVQPQEIAALLWACLYFFCLLASYYVLRPIRDALGLVGGTAHLPWLFLGTLTAMFVANPLFSALVSRLPRRRFIPYTYRFFGLNLLLFFVLLQALPERQQVYVARAFFIWTSVFNLFVVSVFWGFMADGFSSAQGKRLFGFIGVGGTLGAIVGAGSTTMLAHVLGPANLLLLAAVLLECAVFCVSRLARRFDAAGIAEGRPIEPATAPGPQDSAPTLSYARWKPERAGGALDGIARTLLSPYLLGICAYMLLFTISATLLYFEQAEIVNRSFHDSNTRTAFFARIDLLVNVLAILVQAGLTGRIMSTIGVGPTAALLPLITLVGFLLLVRSPTLALLMGVQVARRAADYAIARPAREVFFTVVRRDEKYKAKSFIDTFVYRGGDAVGAGVSGLIRALGGGLATTTILAVPLTLIWAAVALLLGRRQEQLARRRADSASV